MSGKTHLSAVTIAALCFGMITPAFAQEKSAPSQEQVSKEAGSESEEPESKESVDQQYKALTQKAAKAYGAEQYEQSLELFNQAYAIKPVPNLLYNMGRIEEKRGNFDEAIGHYEKFVTEPGVDIKARKDALDRLNTLREVVALRKKGEEVDEEKVREQHDDRQLAASQKADAPQQTRVERSYTPAWITTGVALAAYGGAGFFALQAQSANDDFESATTRQARRDAASSGETSSIVADSMLGLGVVMTGLSVYFFLSPSETEVPADQTAMQLAPQIGPEAAGMTFSVEF